MATYDIRLHGPKNPRADVAAEEMRACLAYDSTTGELRWKVDRLKAKAGAIATWYMPKALRISYYGHSYAAHRIIWLMVTGEWPPHQIDHINGNPHDNRWENLRPATQAQNSVNREYATTSPYRGVRFCKEHTLNPWRARIKILDGKRIELGSYATLEEAYEAYCAAALKYHGAFAKQP